MCGIVGIVSPNQNIDHALFNQAIQALAHRGPDGTGTWFSPDKQIGLGHRRLSIVDIQNGKQPLISEDNMICVTVNGEFYDDKVLRADLEKKGHRFKTRSDSELLIHLYAEYGLKCLDKLRGEFAFILYDAKNQRLIAARDRFGIKPLCYHLTENKTLLLASEAKALFALGVAAKWNDYALFHATCFQYRPLGQTLFKDVFQVLPGQVLIYEREKLSRLQYWDLNYPSNEFSLALPFEEIKTQLEKKFTEAVAMRLRDDENICCHISGGIDSAAIASYAAKIYGKPLPCFTVAFNHAQYDESALARILAEKIGATFHPVFVDAKEIVSVLPEAVYYSESLAINNHLSAKYLLNQAIKGHGYKIALSGEGSDELFLGYPHFKEDLCLASARILHSNPLLNGLQITNESHLSLDAVQKQLGFVPHFFKAKAAIGFKLHALLAESFKEAFSVDEIFTKIVSKKEIKQLENRAPIHLSAYFWIKYALASYILSALGDGCEMAHGIEGRVPFLDHHLFDFVKKIPTHYKIYQNQEKYILRETVKEKVIPEITTRQKHAFMAPPLSLLENQAGIEYIQDELRSGNFGKLPFYNQTQVKRYLDELPEKNQQQQIAAEPVLMMLLTTHLLNQQFLL